MKLRSFPALRRSVALTATLLAAGAAAAAQPPASSALAAEIPAGSASAVRVPGSAAVSAAQGRASAAVSARQTPDAAAAAAQAPDTAASAAPPPVAAMAALKPLSDTNVSGKAAFVQHDGVVEVQAVITGLPPNSEHGFHVHEKGDCSAPDGSSAGGHFAPRGHPHGPQDGPHHAGDMPSLTADGAGMATLNFRMHDVTVSPGPYSVIGKAVIVHAKRDDFKSQPSGDAGARVACGVVQTDDMPAQK